MEYKTLVKIIDVVVKKRLKPIIKEVIKEEVKDQVIRILLENNINKHSIVSDIDDDEYNQIQTQPPSLNKRQGPKVQFESQPSIKTSSFITTNVKKPSNTDVIKEKKKYSSNSVINDILNDVEVDSSFKSDNVNEIIPEGVNPIIEHVPRDISGLPDFLQKAFTKDYSNLIKASEEKTKQRRGII